MEGIRHEGPALDWNRHVKVPLQRVDHIVAVRGARPAPRVAWARLVEARERHVVDARVGLLPGLLFLEGGAADRHAADVRLDMPRRAFPESAAAAAAEVIEQAHETIFVPRVLWCQKFGRSIV